MPSQLDDQLQATLGAAYTLDRELGGGGMSRVWLARETALGRDVVVKLLHPELASGVNVDRFKREIQLAAQLQHPHIVPILSAGEMNGLPYLTMPFVAGRSLRERIAETPALSMGEAVSILRDVARALAYAHGRGIIHRDIKPDNVLLAEGSATVTDFGVAKAVNAARTEAASTLTSIGTSIGTPAYMAPEQCAGDPSTDHRADIYAWGIMAYEILAGRLPFLYKTPHQLLAAQISEVPKPVTDFRPDCPPALASMVMQCLEKNPADRPQSAAAILQALSEADAISGGHDTKPAIGLATRQSLLRALVVYAAAFVAVAIVARAAVISFGLPDWAFTGTLIVMALGLPVILFTAWAHHGSRVARTMATVTPGGSVTTQSPMSRLAVRASPHVTWRRTTIGGFAALAVFVLLVSGFMVARAKGIGPFGSLMGKKLLDAKDRVLVTDFSAPANDSSLGSVVSEAVRTNLAQSRAVSVMQTSAIAGALTRMQRPAVSHVDVKLAREMAEREGIKAIIDGSITPVGTSSSYVVTTRIIAAANGDVVAIFHETAKDATDLIPAIDRVTRAMREKIGESLKSVRETAPLMQATTASLPALRKYTDAFRANAVEQDFLKAIKAFEEAIHLDTNFALAYRGASLAYGNARLRPARSESLRVRAFELRDRLPDLERALVEGQYYNAGSHADRPRAIAAYLTVLDHDARSNSGTNALGLLYGSRREYARAESVFSAQISSGQANAFIYTNLVPVLLGQGKVDQAQQVYDEYRARFPGNAAGVNRSWMLARAKGWMDSMTMLCHRAADGPDLQMKTQALICLGEVARMQGRIRDEEGFTRVGVISDSVRGGSSTAAIAVLDSAFNDIWFLDQTSRGVQRLDALVAKKPVSEYATALEVPWVVIETYAAAGRADRANAILAQYDAAVAKDTASQRLLGYARHRALGAIAVAEGKYDVAIREYQRGDTSYDGGPTTCASCTAPRLAHAYDLAGRRDDAIRVFEEYVNSSYPYRVSTGIDGQFLAGTYKRLGELYEDKGDVSKAILYFGKFVDLWKNADPELQPKVAEVKRRLALLQAREKR